ncbi:C6 transcription factor [Penicillium citrinum]|uniref:C6 transcription factor n=2 Tax=Penicillium TaxID=5073 RepID=A0A9W9NQU2_PENCI|nr:C6 transcription factor [Penicillium citrinum]KAJ5224476.1 C6 transcription factor [Penicillium citrinum]KAJ5574728.1 C6 transcription factor [Penicillium hetheringtonii]
MSGQYHPLDDKGSSVPSVPARQRSRHACLPCRRRKRKCDGQFPCNICKGYDYECEYDETSQNISQKRKNLSIQSSYEPKAKHANKGQLDDRSTQDASASILPGVLEPSKARYVGRYSSIAFPLYVGLEVQATNLPRLHSFAYHTGIREEPPCAVQSEVAEHISWNDARSLIDVYSTTIHPVFGFIDTDLSYNRCREHWHGRSQGLVFEAMICGIFALASLFKERINHESEMWLMLHAKKILEDSDVCRFPSLEQIAAWILRTLYLRCTGRPHVTWLASCTIMHLVEAIGLHHAPESAIQTGGSGAPHPETSHAMNRIAQVANCLHILIAFEYGRSILPVNRRVLEYIDHTNRGTDLTPQLCRLITMLPTNQHVGDTTLLGQELFSALDKIAEIAVEHDFLVLLKTDLVLGIYRRLRVLDSKFQHGHYENIISAGLESLPAARRLVSQNQPWWNLVGSVFQFVCTLLVIDTPASCEALVDTMDALEFVVRNLDTHLAREALLTARQLVHASLSKKRKGVEILERVVGTEAPVVAPSQTADQIAQDVASLSPLLAAQLPFDLDLLWNTDFQLPL